MHTLRTSAILFAALACLRMSALHAQEPAGRFEPIPLLGTLEIGREWYEGSIVMAPNSLRTFEDSVRARGSLVGITVVQRDSSADGWIMRMTFDANSQGYLGLVAIRARKVVKPKDAPAQFARMTQWITNALIEKVAPVTSAESQNISRWTWLQHRDYTLTLRTVTTPATKTSKAKTYLEFTLLPR